MTLSLKKFSIPAIMICLDFLIWTLNLLETLALRFECTSSSKLRLFLSSFCCFSCIISPVLRFIVHPVTESNERLIIFIVNNMSVEGMVIWTVDEHLSFQFLVNQVNHKTLKASGWLIDAFRSYTQRNQEHTSIDLARASEYAPEMCPPISLLDQIKYPFTYRLISIYYEPGTKYP